MRFPFFNFKRKVKSQLTKATGGFSPIKASPDELLGELFQDVQLRRIYPDGAQNPQGLPTPAPSFEL
jgi:hypothetical protein